ncbi:hypothetical protein [Nitrospira defluvii]|uniref:Uncharacterized protein n=1 Tax=Nitrospira defluvii TaxID=330214 RepID=A0ABN7MFL0_9BACT|nr:hypothetical protein [Nitrospira defluvii]CAE6799936.1 hypothetical protein NSPZN2_80011 [Nitrospira defluvii]
MSGRTKNEAIIEALESAGYQDIRLKVVPKRFLFSNGRCQAELEFSRNYFDDTTLVTLQGLMQETILPAIKQQLGKRVYVDARGIRITPSTHSRADKC